MTCLLGRLKASVTFAMPVGSGWPCSSIKRAHSKRSCTPAKAWMALSMQWCPGTKQPCHCRFSNRHEGTHYGKPAMESPSQEATIWHLGEHPTGKRADHTSNAHQKEQHTQRLLGACKQTKDASTRPCLPAPHDEQRNANGIEGGGKHHVV